MDEILSEEELTEIERIRDPNVMWKELPTIFDSHRALASQVEALATKRAKDDRLLYESIAREYELQKRITELEAALQASHG